MKRRLLCDIKVVWILTAGYLIVTCRTDIQAGGIHLGAVGLKMVFKVVDNLSSPSVSMNELGKDRLSCGILREQRSDQQKGWGERVWKETKRGWWLQAK